MLVNTDQLFPISFPISSSSLRTTPPHFVNYKRTSHLATSVSSFGVCCSLSRQSKSPFLLAQHCDGLRCQIHLARPQNQHGCNILGEPFHRQNWNPCIRRHIPTTLYIEQQSTFVFRLKPSQNEHQHTLRAMGLSCQKSIASGPIGAVG